MSSSRAAPRVSVIVVSHNEGDHLRRTVQSLLASLPEDGEIVVVDDGSTDGSLECLANGYRGVRLLRLAERRGAIAARNQGAALAQGDIVVFSDAHVETPLDWTDELLGVLARSDVGAVGPVISDMDQPASRGYGFRWSDPSLTMEWLGWRESVPHAVPLLGAGFMAMRREVFEAVGGFDDGLRLWGSEDGELSLRLWSLGYQCLLVPTVEVAHLFRPAHPYPMPWNAILHNILRVAVIHFGPERTRAVVERMATQPAFSEAFALLAAGDAWRRRDAFRAARVRDDAWFFDRFGATW